MTDGYKAAVFNQDEGRFMEAAEAIEHNSPLSIKDLHLFLRTHAIGLNNYIAHYIEDIVEPLNTDEETGEIGEKEQRSPGAFRAGALTTFKMVHMVSQETGAALPSLVSDLGKVPVDDVSSVYDLHAPIINHFYRGAELRDKFPHLYGPVLKLMHVVSGASSIEALRADLATPIYSHRNMDAAFSELHFLGGAAETILAIEARAAGEP